MKKRILALSLAAAMLVGAMASCSAKEEVVSSQAVEARDIKLVLWGPEQDQDFLKAISKEWGDKYAADNADVKSVTVDVQIVGENDAPNNAMNDIAAAADVFGIPSDNTKTLSDNNAIFPISESVAAQVKDIIGDNTTYQSALWNGTMYGIPYTDNTAAVLYYNKEKISDEDAKSLNTILEKGKLGIESSGGWHDMMWFGSAGGELYTNHNKDVNTLNSDDTAKLLAWLAVQVKDGKIARADKAESLSSWMQDGQVDAAIMGAWDAGTYQKILGDNYGVAELPCITVEGSGINNKHMMCFGGSKLNVINAQTKEPEAAMSLALYISSLDAQVKRFQDPKAHKSPASVSLLSNAEIAADPTVAANVAQTSYIVNASPLVGVSSYWGEMPGIINDIVDGKLSEEADIKARLDAAVTKMQENVNK